MISIRRKDKIWITGILLTVATLAVFWQVREFGFIHLDDPVYVTKNHRIQSGLSPENIRWALGTTHAEFWHPLTWLSLMLNYQLFGLNAGGYHMTNLIFHILSSLLLFRLFHRMTQAMGKSAFVAAFFVLHPLHVESVAWIAERKDVLSAFWGMLTLYLYVYYTENQNIRRYLPVVLSFVLGLMSKSSLVTLPLIMILMDYWPLRRLSPGNYDGSLLGRQLKEKLPFFLLAVGFALITIWVQPSVSHFPLSERLANALVSFVIYLRKSFFPVDLAVFYPFSTDIPAWKIAGAFGFVVMVTIFAFIVRKRHPYFFVGWLWYAITVLPFLGILQVGNHAMADRYTYLSLTGASIIAAWGAPLVFQKRFAKKILCVCVIAFFIVLALLSWKQCGYWRNDKELFSHALRVTQGNYLAHICLGSVFENEGKNDLAIAHCNEAIRLKPNYANSYNCRGSVYYRMGDYTKALRDCQQAIKVQPDYAESYYYEGLTYHRLKKYPLAIKSLDQAISLKPDRADFHVAKGNNHFALKEYPAAHQEYDKAVRLKPDYAEAFQNRGIVSILQGNRSAGCADLRKSCHLGLCPGLKWATANQHCRSLGN